MTLFSIFIASLLGSAHCVGMCGGFVACASGDCKRPAMPIMAYHFGRLSSYLLLGLIAGIVGQSIDAIGAVVDLQRLSAILIGCWLIAFGLRVLYRGREVVKTTPADSWWYRFVLSCYRKVFKTSTTSPKVRGYAIGFLSALLPCGWLYTFVAVAVATGSLFGGSLVMLVFWLGTVPLLSLFGTLSSSFLAKIGQASPRFTAAVFVCIGLFAIMGKVDIGFIAGDFDSLPFCHPRP